MNILRHRWNLMFFRCYNPKYQYYDKYGGRGIQVCDEWLEFERFQDWALNNGFDKSLSLDRINNNKDYSPANCRWATSEQQQRNKSNNTLSEGVASEIKWLAQNGKSLSWIAECYGVPLSSVNCVATENTWKTVQPVKPSFTLVNMILKSEQRAMSKNNTSGHTGIWKKRNKWCAELIHKGKRVLRKSFPTLDEAILARANKIKEVRQLS